MNLEKQYIAQLLSEMEQQKNAIINTEEYQLLKSENKELERRIQTLTSEKSKCEEKIKELKSKTDNSEVIKLRKELKQVKENMKKPAIIKSEDNSIEIFKKIKEGNGCIQPLHSTKTGWKTLRTHPFTLELGNLGCIFEEVKLKGCFERNGFNRTYFYNEEATATLNREILLQILGVTEREAYNCNVVTKTSYKKGRKFKYFSLDEILKKNITFNVKKQKFVSNEYTKFVYTLPDGSKIILCETGEEEVI